MSSSKKPTATSVDDLSSTEVAVLKTMHSRRLYGSKHKRIETVMRSGFPKHLLGDVKKAIYDLINKGFVVYAKKDKKAIQLNIKRCHEIMEIVKK